MAGQTHAQPVARATSRLEGDVLEVEVAGTWRITDPKPDWAGLVGGKKPARVRLHVDAVERWDSSLLLFLFEIAEWCRASGLDCDASALPEKVRQLLGQLASSHRTSVPHDRSRNFLATVGVATMQLSRKAQDFVQFFGECVLGAVRLLKRPDRFRWRDALQEMQDCGAMALPIVSLIAFLVGVTLAYIGALVLRQYGGDIYVADLIGMAMVREMGAVMTAVVLAGRTGAAYAATLGNMKANEEIDALETLGISPVQFLVMPRLMAIGVMMPLLSLYANALGIIGGMAVSAGVLNIPAAAFWVEMGTIVTLRDIAAGVIKATSFGFIVGLSGCLRGLQAERSAAGVGRAATSAVVTSIMLLVVADAIFAVLFNAIGL